MAKQTNDDRRSGCIEGMTSFESRLVNLLGMLLIQERQQGEQVRLLDRAGFRPTEIATLIGTTPNSVRAELSRQRSSTAKGGKAKKG